VSVNDLEATGLDACGDCALSNGEGCCGGGDHGHGALRSDRAVAAASAAVTLLLLAAVATVPSSRVAWVLVPAAATALAALAQLGLALVSLRVSGATGDAAIRRALRLLPAVAGGLVVSLGLALAAVLTT
jgi:hypothetical protein